MVALIRGAALILALGAGTATAQLLDRVVAVIEEDIITLSELEERVTIVGKQVQQSGMPMPPRSQFVAQVLEHMVIARLQMQLAERQEVSLPTDAVVKEIHSLAERNGMDLRQFRRQVEQEGVRFASFYNYLHERLLTQHLQQIESRRLVRVTEDEIDNFLRLHADRLQTDNRYRLNHILIATRRQMAPGEKDRHRAKAQTLAERIRGGENFASLALTESDGRNALNGGDIGWRVEAELPGFAADAITKLEIGETTEPLQSPSGFHLFYLADKEGGEQVMVDQTRSRHILIRPNALIDDREAFAQLNTLKDRINGGDRFEDLARSHSDDTASAADGGNLGWTSQGMMDPYFEEQMNRLEINEVSEPFQTSFGWHIVQVLERRQVDETESTLRTRALNHLARSRVNDEIEIWLRRMLNNSYVRYMTEEQGV